MSDTLTSRGSQLPPTLFAKGATFSPLEGADSWRHSLNVDHVAMSVVLGRAQLASEKRLEDLTGQWRSMVGIPLARCLTVDSRQIYETMS